MYYLSNSNSAFTPYIKMPLRLGNGFTAMGDDTLITVKLLGNDAQDSGTLYYMDPVTGQQRELFSNKDSSRFGEEVILGKVPRGAPIVFKYVNSTDNRSKYTGANAPGTYAFDEDPVLKGLAINGKPMPVSSQLSSLGDRRWAVAGRVDRGTVLFGFEDIAIPNPDFNDIVFLLTGVQLDSEIKLPTPIVSESNRVQNTTHVTFTMPTTSQSPELRIFYTLDGTTPYFDENGPVGTSTYIYGGPFSVTGNTEVQALAWRPSVEDSTVGVTRYLSSDVVKTHIRFPTALAGGMYVDSDGDGRIDGARIFLAHPIPAPPASLFLEDPFRSEAELKITAADMALEGAAGDILVARFPDRSFAFGTGFPVGAYATVPAGLRDLMPGAYPLGDSVPPVLASVEAAPPQGGNGAWMQATFSEEVLVDPAPAFPFAIRRAFGADPNGQVQVETVRKLDARTYLYLFAAGSDLYPVPGDSLRLLGHPSVTDRRGLHSRMSFHVAVTGAPSVRRGDILAQGGDFTVGGMVVDPRPLKIPVSLVQVDDAVPGGKVICLDCRSGEWKSTDANRPADFPDGPRIDIITRGPFTFDISFFSHLGMRVNRAQGAVSASMLAGVPVDAEGYKRVALMWYPVSERGHQVGTGVYIAQGTYRSLPAPGIGRQGERASLTPVVRRIGYRFGYVRR